MIKAIIFDFYGVIRSDEYHSWLHRHGLNTNQGYADANRQMNQGQTTLEEFLEKLSDISGLSVESIHREIVSNSLLNKAMLDLIFKLKPKYKIAILSNASSPHLRESLAKTGTEKLFDAVVISSELGITKPDTSIFNYCLDKLDVTADEAIYIDDNQRFVDAANKLGLTAYCYSGTDDLKQHLSKLGVVY